MQYQALSNKVGVGGCNIQPQSQPQMISTGFATPYTVPAVDIIASNREAFERMTAKMSELSSELEAERRINMERSLQEAKNKKSFRNGFWIGVGTTALALAAAYGASRYFNNDNDDIVIVDGFTPSGY